MAKILTIINLTQNTMKTNINYSTCSIVNRELQSIKESNFESMLTAPKVQAVKTKQGRKLIEVIAAIAVPLVVFTIVFILNHFHLIKEF